MENDIDGKVVQVNDIDLFYKEYGQGEPLILLHGWFGSNEFWDPYIKKFSEEYRVIVPDLRGHGRSTNPDNYEFSEREIAYDIYALCDHLGIQKIKGLGFSSGADTLLQMATQQPLLIESMVLMGGGHYYYEEIIDNNPETSLGSLEPQFLELIRKWHEKGDEQIRFLLYLFNKYGPNPTPADLSSITAETLIIHGDRDEFYQVSIAVEMVQAISNSYLWVVPNASHAFFFDAFGGKAPGGDLFPQLALEFLRGDWVSL